MARRPRQVLSRRRIVIGTAAGTVAAAATALLLGWVAVPSVFWLVTATTWMVLTLVDVWGMDAEETARWATREDPTIPTTHLILIVASLASLGGVALLLVGVHDSGQAAASLLGLGSVAASWATVHTVFTLGYAALYYTGPDGGISFNQQEAPAYADFAYLGFTIGMTYQVSDTNLETSAIRRTALKHALLSYFLGAVVLAISINTVVSLAS